ncbi:hypothetical protein CT0861_08515 [Colletotrichum tofieldiae]|uniref:Uncharacterized protein n=1 Tax=Colletotrichum tofieldiae TaxID=708197 RepID=A0A161Y445_9PEZI|nr:hypothetical protein CT0861_08515 [Colletotrichum tofieldiae]
MRAPGLDEIGSSESSATETIWLSSTRARGAVEIVFCQASQCDGHALCTLAHDEIPKLESREQDWPELDEVSAVRKQQLDADHTASAAQVEYATLSHTTTTGVAGFVSTGLAIFSTARDIAPMSTMAGRGYVCSGR